MEYRKLGNLDVSVIGLGTLRTFDVNGDEEIAVRSQIVDSCLSNNINLIDTAAWYGNAEQVLGEITEGRRNKFYLATKVRTESKEAGEAQIERSLSDCPESCGCTPWAMPPARTRPTSRSRWRCRTTPTPLAATAVPAGSSGPYLRRRCWQAAHRR